MAETLGKQPALAAFWRFQTDHPGTSRDLAPEQEERLSTCIRDWNTWAEGLLNEKAELENSGKWNVRVEPGQGRVGVTDDTIEWISRAALELPKKESDYIKNSSVRNDIFLSDIIIPWDIIIPKTDFTVKIHADRTIFRGDIWIRSTVGQDRRARAKNRNVVFSSSDAQFHGSIYIAGEHVDSINITDAKIFGNVRINNLKNWKSIDFSRSKISDRVTIQDIEPYGRGKSAHLLFSDVNFEKSVNISKSYFPATSSFKNSRFEDSVNISEKVVFSGFTDFTNVDFMQAVTLDDVTFDYACLVGIAAKAGFIFHKEVRFKEVPDFDQASFAVAPRLDDIQSITNSTYFDFKHSHLNGSPLNCWVHKIFVKRGLVGPAQMNLAPRKIPDHWHVTTPSARYRSLRRIAIGGHDIERELEFSAEELKNRRFHEDFPFGPNAFRFWLTFLYGAISKYGRSARRPFFLWILLVVLFAAIYLLPISGRPLEPTGSSDPTAQAATISVWDCVVPEGHQGALKEALSLSLRNSFFMLLTGNRSADWYRMGCLYGRSTAANAPSSIQNIPFQYRIIASIQNILSLPLVFLLLLAIRNAIRLK